jgi:hypothetical protein
MLTFVVAEDTEAGDVVSLANAEVTDMGDFLTLPIEPVKLISDPEDVDSFNVRLHFASGSVVVTRNSELQLDMNAMNEDVAA